MAGDARKDPLRADISQQRAAVSAGDWVTDDAARTALALGAVGKPRGEGVLALYASRPGEPGTADLTDALTASGWRVLLPLLRRTPDWAWFTGRDGLRAGWAGIPEPTGPGLGADAIALAEIVIAPCLAVGLDGTRLGTGGGWYDRALTLRRADTKVLVMAREAEVLASVPSEPHDVRVDVVVTGSAVRNLPAL